MIEQAGCHATRARALHRFEAVSRTLSRARGSRRRWTSPTPVRVVRPSLGQSPLLELRFVRSVIALVALVLGAYCLIVAATALYAQPVLGHPDPEELAARERYQWPGLIPVVFLALVAGYAVAIAARRRGRRRNRTSPPSTQDPPPITQSRDTASR